MKKLIAVVLIACVFFSVIPVSQASVPQKVGRVLKLSKVSSKVRDFFSRQKKKIPAKPVSAKVSVPEKPTSNPMVVPLPVESDSLGKSEGGLNKVGKNVSNAVWDNKGAIATGVVLTTFAANPEPFVEGVASVVKATTEKTIDTVTEKVLPTPTPHQNNGTDNVISRVMLLGVIALMVCLFLLYRIRNKNLRRRITGVALLFLCVVICCFGVIANAAAAQGSGVVGGNLVSVLCDIPPLLAISFANLLKILLNIILIVVSVVPLGG